MRTPLDVQSAMRWVLVAVLPCVVMGVFDTGLQANRAIASGASPTPGWRIAFLSALGLADGAEGVAAALVHGVLYLGPAVAVALAAGFAVERGMARLRGREADHGALGVIALLFALCLPPTIPLARVAFGAVMAFFVGKEVFGGLGRNFLNPPLTGLAFLYFAYPGALSGDDVWVAVDGVSGATPLAIAAQSGMEGIRASGLDWRTAFVGLVPGAMGGTSPLAALLGAVVLVRAGLAPARILAGGVLGLVLGVALLRAIGVEGPAISMPWTWHALTGGFAFGLVFLATDPVTGSITPPGRFAYGLLIGVLVVVIRVANPAHRDGVMLAILLGNVAAPLLDHVAARLWMRRWRAIDGG
ncbi:MAG: RnfABCDGE type electron transport complex subunit D [Myxococcota bacterium]